MGLFFWSNSQFQFQIFSFCHIVKFMISLYKLNTCSAGPIFFSQKLWSFWKTFSWHRHSIYHVVLQTNSKFGSFSPGYCTVYTVQCTLYRSVSSPFFTTTFVCKARQICSAHRIEPSYFALHIKKTMQTSIRTWNGDIISGTKQKLIFLNNAI